MCTYTFETYSNNIAILNGNTTEFIHILSELTLEMSMVP